MGKRASFNLEESSNTGEGFTYGSDDHDDSINISCSPIRNAFIVIITIGIVLLVGLLAFYVPDSGCGVKEYITTKAPTQGTQPPQTSKVTDVPTKPTEGRPTTGPMLPTTVMPWDGRLPQSIWPMRYELFLTPYLYEEDVDGDGPGERRFTFDGEVNIRVRCQEVTNRVTVHIVNITVYTVKVFRMTGNTDEDLLDQWWTDDYYQFLNMETTIDMTVGEDYEVQITYLGELNNLLVGLYRSSYRNENDELKWLAATQFQATDARRALPCFDEPDFKAVFDTTIRHRADMVAITNGIELSTRDWDGVPGWKETMFKRTPRMSTYLLAFVVCDFVYTKQITPNGVLFRTWSRPNAINTTDYALYSGVNILTYFEEYFDYAYPMDKQDMVAIPDFAAGAMENWGLILYRENLMLYDPKVNSASNKNSVADVIAHEVAHQWFGNVVTPIWWGEFWLNEGFAVYCEDIGVNITEPTWQVHERFGIERIMKAFTVDGLGSSYPLVIPVNSPQDLSEQAYASLPYDKADQYFGQRDVKKIMDTWTLNMGFPLVTFDRLDTTTANISQKHFLIDPDSPVDPDNKYGDIGYIWEIEVSHTHASEQEYAKPKKDFMEREQSKIIQLSAGIQDGDWYLANIKQYGYYRVNYDDTNWDRLTTQLSGDHTLIPVENRAQLIDDAFNLARSGEISQIRALSLTTYLDKEMDYVPWQATLSVMAYIRDMFSRYSGYGPLEKYMLQKITPLYNFVGWEDDPNDPLLTQYNRVNAISTACRYGMDDCRSRVSLLYMEYMENYTQYNPISPNLKSVVYCYGIKEGGQAEWEFGLERYQATSDSSEKNTWLYGLSCTQEPWILSRFLELVFDSSIVRQGDAPRLIGNVAKNYAGRALAWDFVREQWEFLKNYYGDAYLGNNIKDTTEHFNTDFALNQLLDFGEGKDLGGASRTYQQQVEKIKANIKWMTNNAEETAKWLDEQTFGI
ncbi:aminopeptidase N-like [Amphiura filiformis]|uniref:aminopeptidase N-like n=1 Tax=Amphiura filiformis TaxID=82378 RepID=UPI003B21A56C